MKSFFSEKDINPKEFQEIIQNKTQKADCPLCDDIQKNIPIYDARKIASSQEQEKYKNEINHIFEKGAGVLVLKHMYEDLDIIDKKTKIFYDIAQKESTNLTKSDHFAPSNANLRIWNSLEKAALEDSEIFIEYYKNSILRLISESWLGPFYQVTAQVNVVKPNGKAQNPHRDYHLGFQENHIVEKFPINAHIMSQMLTLQGAVAHSDMPIESGPTMLLPFSQKYPLGYLAYKNQDFQDIFYKNYVQLPLEKGDGVFFNPALFHGAGSNQTKSFDRIANLLQISSTFGKTMETLNFHKMISHIYPSLLEKFSKDDIKQTEVENVCLCICDNYAFPTNLDKDLPSSNLTPQSIFELTYQSILEKVPYQDFQEKLKDKYKVKA